MKYDIYYSTGGGSMVYGGSDVWVNQWLKNVAPHLEHPSKLLIHRRKPNFQVEFDSPIEIVWQDDPREFDNIVRRSRKIHILHGYYTPHKVIEDNRHKIESMVMHVCIKMSMHAGFQLNVPKLMHFNAEPAWEENVIKWAKKVIWIGMDKTPHHDNMNIIDIPNYYEFNNNQPCNDSNVVGYAARVETRKSVHFLNDVDSVAFTAVKPLKWWVKNKLLKMDKLKVIQFDYKNLHKFYSRNDWGISHSCHLNEPFGYSIFQAFDYGKIPILQMDWEKDYEYPFRAYNKKEFDEKLKDICELSVNERQQYVDDFKHRLSKYDNKQEWTDRYLEIYNS
tara:strand:- start:786 stop:1790 length:1005 start_codon:yes stop_codon:yes gene_type:complete